METEDDFTVNDIGIKCRSKREVYSVLTSEGGLYLPPMPDCTQKFLRGVLIGDKSYIRCKDVRVIKVPHLDGLRVKGILSWARERIDIDRFLPEYEYDKEPSREWLCNVIHTLLDTEFTDFIIEKQRLREKKVITNKNLGIEAKPEFVQIFRKSNSVSVSKGKTYFLARKQRRAAEEIKENERSDSDNKDKEKINELEGKLIEYMDKLKTFEEKEDENSKHKECLAKLYEDGIINSDGEYIEKE